MNVSADSKCLHGFCVHFSRVCFFNISKCTHECSWLWIYAFTFFQQVRFVNKQLLTGQEERERKEKKPPQAKLKSTLFISNGANVFSSRKCIHTLFVACKPLIHFVTIECAPQQCCNVECNEAIAKLCNFIQNYLAINFTLSSVESDVVLIVAFSIFACSFELALGGNWWAHYGNLFILVMFGF